MGENRVLLIDFKARKLGFEVFISLCQSVSYEIGNLGKFELPSVCVCAAVF